MGKVFSKDRFYTQEDVVMTLQTCCDTKVTESLNPVLRSVLSTEVENIAGEDLYRLDLELEHTTVSLNEAHPCQARERVVEQAILMIVGLQLPAGVLSYLVSPSLEWELIVACFVCLLGLKGLAAKVTTMRYANGIIVLGAVVANVLTGMMCGEVLHFLVALLHNYWGGVEAAATTAAGIFVVSFYVSFIGDILYIKRTAKMKREITTNGKTIIVIDSPRPLRDKERLWLVWGLSTSAMWSPLYIFYLVARLVDYLTAALLLDFICEVFFIWVGRRRR
jgi:hypothetical protein